ncbi:MAG: DUF599 domain-containing protein [Pseudomonadales bacterium]|nr:DUF599 domain-containing protein [Pseudomonadales bacterium]
MVTEISLQGYGLMDTVALAWFFVCWFGYAFYSERKAQRKDCLSSVLHRHRIRWMGLMMARENRVSDASLIANLERNVSFFASSTLLILAGVVTALGAAEELQGAFQNVSWVVHSSLQVLQIKFLVLAGIFIYAFFKFTWSLRQYGFACVIIGSAPFYDRIFSTNETQVLQQESLAADAAHVISRAAHAFNLGLRSYYFALSFLVWFIHPLFFMAVSAWVVAVLYRREFKSRVLKAMIRSDKTGPLTK